MTLGWRLYQLRPGFARAWLSPPSKRNPQPGPSLNHYSRREILGTVLVVEHTARFSSANVLLQRPRAGAHDLSAWDDPVWINVWSSENHLREPTGVFFCAATPSTALPAWEDIEQEAAEQRQVPQMTDPPALPPPWSSQAASQQEVRVGEVSAVRARCKSRPASSRPPAFVASRWKSPPPERLIEGTSETAGGRVAPPVEPPPRSSTGSLAPWSSALPV